MDAITLSFAVATFGTALVSLKRQDARTAALVMCGIWASTITLERVGLSWTDMLTVNVAIDTCAAIGFVLAWRMVWPPRPWLLALSLTFFAQVAAHRMFTHQLRTLQITLNVLYALQLLTIVIGPRVGQIAGHARDFLDGMSAPVDRRHRRRGVVARADDAVCKAGEWWNNRPVREKSR